MSQAQESPHPLSDEVPLPPDCRVLLVDADLRMVHDMRRFLETQTARFEVATADSAESAFMRMVDFTPDVVVMDICLPDMNGIEILNPIKDLHPNARIVVLTHDASAETRDAALREGAVRFLQKPVDLQALQRLLLTLAREPRKGDTGILEGGGMDVLDLAQMMFICRKSTSIRFASGRRCGSLRFENGEAVHIDDGQAVGPEAFFHMAALWGQGRFHTLSEDAAPLLPNNTIPTVTLLLDGAILRDQINAGIPLDQAISRLIQTEAPPPEEAPKAPEAAPSDAIQSPIQGPSLPELFRELMAMPGLRMAMVTDAEGGVRQGQTRHGALRLESLGAVLASSLGSTQVIGRELQAGRTQLAMVEYQGGTLLARSLGQQGILAILVDPEANLGLLRYLLNKQAPEFERALQG